MRDAFKGIRVEYEVDRDRPKDIGQLFDFELDPDPDHPPVRFLTPTGVLLRGNRFQRVDHPYLGSALASARIIDKT